MKNQDAILKVSGGVLITVLTVVIYHHAFFNGFVSDDGFQILQNPWIKDIRFIPGIFGHSLSGFSTVSFQQATYRPLMYAAFTIEYALFGLNPFGWHAVNIFVHALNGLLVFFITFALLRSFTEQTEAERGSISTWLSAIVAAALFVSHPISSEPVSWVSALPELSFVFLVLTAFYLHVRERRGSARASIIRYVPGPMLFFTALLFKETAIVLPFILFIYDILAKRHRVVQGKIRSKALLVYGAYVPAFALYMALRLTALGHIGSGGSSMNAYLGPGGLFLNVIEGFYKGMVLLFFPMGKGMYPFQIFHALSSPFEPRAVIALIFTASFFSGIFFLRKKLHALVLLALAFMVLPILPALYTPVISRFAFAPRYLYLSSVGYAVFLAFIVRWLFRKGPLRGRYYLGGVATALSWVLIIFCSVVSAHNSLDWSDNLSLARASLKGSSDNYYALYQIGNAEQERGSYDEAGQSYSKAIAIIAKQEHKDLQTLRDALLGLGGAELALGSIDEAIGVYEKVRGVWYGNATANYQLGYIYQGKGQCGKALVYYGRALEGYKSRAGRRDTLLNMGNCYARLSLYDAALDAYGKALEISPADPLVRRNMETVRRRMERR